MLTLTEDAVSAIEDLTSQPDLPADTGLRIMAQTEGGPSFQLELADGPAAGDQVVERGGARVFVEPTAAAVLEDKALDAQLNEQGDLTFCISEQGDRGLPVHPSRRERTAMSRLGRRAREGARKLDAWLGRVLPKRH